MSLFKMYHGDANQSGSEQYAQGITSTVSTAQECYDIFQRALSDGRFPGEYIAFHSHTGIDGVLLEVVKECAGMSPFMLHMTNDGYLMVHASTGYVVGFVYSEEGERYATVYHGIAYIGG